MISKSKKPKMKRLLILASFIFLMAGMQAQLPNGSIAPDFTLQDINGNTIHLYDYLDSGKAVVIDFYEVMCSPCWIYHESHSLAKAYNAWGPGGTSELMVLEIEGIKSTVNQIRGTEQPTKGDWTAGEPFPFIATCSPNTDEVTVKYRVGFFPMVYMICRDRRLKLIGPSDTSVIRSNLNLCPSAPADSLFLDLVAIDSLKYVTCNNYTHLILQFQNYGLKTITSAQIRMSLDNSLVDTIPWTGNAKTYETLKVDGKLLNQLSDGSHTVTYLVTAINGQNSGFRQDTLSRRFTVLNTWQELPFNEDFSRAGFPYNKWTVRNLYPDIQTWERAELGYTNALRIPFFNIPDAYPSTVFFPGLSFTINSGPVLRFDIACTHNNSVIRHAGYDLISLEYSTNCGMSYSTVASISEIDYQSAPDDSAYFIPKQDQWKPVVIDLSKLAFTDNIILAFSSQSTFGNNMYIRNIRLDNSSGIADGENSDKICLYPLPVKDKLFVRIYDQPGKSALMLYNAEGKQLWTGDVQASEVCTIPMSACPPGVYFLNVLSASINSTKKVIKW